MFDALRTFYHITCVKNIHIEPFFIAKRRFYYVTVADICNLLRLIKRGYGSESSVSFFSIDIYVHMRFFHRHKICQTYMIKSPMCGT